MSKDTPLPLGCRSYRCIAVPCPGVPPGCTSQDDQDQFFACNVQVPGVLIPLDLQPVLPMPRPTTPGAGGIRSHLCGGWGDRNATPYQVGTNSLHHARSDRNPRLRRTAAACRRLACVPWRRSIILLRNERPGRATGYTPGPVFPMSTDIPATPVMKSSR